MTYLGTRPPTLDEWEKYERHHRARLAIKPGITGMWQVSGRSETIDNDNTLSILKSQSLIWNINACERGVREQCLSKQDKLYYKAIIEKYAKYGKYYNKKVRLKIFMIVHMFGLYEVYAHFK